MESNQAVSPSGGIGRCPHLASVHQEDNNLLLPPAIETTPLTCMVEAFTVVLKVWDQNIADDNSMVSDSKQLLNGASLISLPRF